MGNQEGHFSKGQRNLPVNQANQTKAANPVIPGKSGKLCRGACSGMMLQKSTFGHVQQCMACKTNLPRSSHIRAKPGQSVSSAARDHGRVAPQRTNGWTSRSPQGPNSGLWCVM